MTRPSIHVEALEPRHAAVLFEDLQAIELYTFIPDEPPESEQALRERYARLAAGGRDGVLWMNWVMSDAGRAVGTLQATVYADHRALIAYLVLPRCWRRGYGAAGVTWMLESLRDEYGVRRAEALIDTRNAASIGLVEALGFRREETIVGAAVLKGGASDEYRYAREI